MRFTGGPNKYDPADHAVPDSRLVVNLKRAFWIGLLLFIWLNIIPEALWKYNQWRKYTPTINPNPQYFLTVQGHVDPAMRRDLSIQWHATYATTNPACKGHSSWFNSTEFSDEPEFDQMYYFDYPVKIEADGSYQLKIPMDAIEAENCRWELGDLAYSYKYKKFNYSPGPQTAVEFRKNKAQSKLITQTWKCTNSECDITEKNYSITPGYLYFNNNQIFQANFKE